MPTVAPQPSPQHQPAWLLPALNGLMQPVADRARASRTWWHGWRDQPAERLVRMHRQMGGQAAISKAGYCDRARRLDDQVLSVLGDGTVDAVIEIGCGLSTRAQRLKSSLPWFALDDVPLYRCWSCFFQECDRIRFIPAGLPQRHWLQYLRRRCRRPLIIMEGHGVGIAPALAVDWQHALEEHFPGVHLIGESHSIRQRNAQKMVRGQALQSLNASPLQNRSMLEEGA